MRPRRRTLVPGSTDLAVGWHADLWGSSSVAALWSKTAKFEVPDTSVPSLGRIESGTGKRQLADGDGYAQAELSPRNLQEPRRGFPLHPPGGEAPAPNPNSGEACTIRSRQRSSAEGVTVPVLFDTYRHRDPY